MSARSVRERFLAKVTVDLDGPRPVDEAPCWLWTGWRAGGNRDGGPPKYGVFDLRHGRKIYAHRFIYEMWFGPIPDGLYIDHLCRVPLCVNPGHLEAVTCRENLLRGTGWAATNAAKVTCKNGHKFDSTDHRGARVCSTCAKDRERRRSRKRGAQ